MITQLGYGIRKSVEFIRSIPAFVRKKLKGYRTFVVSIIMATVPFLQMTEVADVMPEDVLPWYAFGMALVSMYMRSITTTALGKSE